MHRKARITAAATLFCALVCAPAPEAHRTDTTPPASLHEIRLASSLDSVQQLRRSLDSADADRIVRAVHRNAERFDLDPGVILAVIHVESRFDAGAVSSRGAMGLMQLMPSTAREVAGGLGLEWTGDQRLFDPELNVLLGTCYLRYLIDRFDDRDTALAAYNAGPTRVAARRRLTGDVPQAYAERVWKAHARIAAL